MLLTLLPHVLQLVLALVDTPGTALKHVTLIGATQERFKLGFTSN